MPFALVVYDIADDRRRTAVARLLSEHGPRVQLSVFEVEIATPRDRAALGRAIADLIEDDEDQVRIYDMPVLATRRSILGNRTLEERQAFYVV